MKKSILILLALLAAWTAGCALSSSELYTRLQSAYRNLSTFQASVQQSNYYPQLKKSINYSGRIYFTPGRMLMSFTKPGIQVLKIENGRVELYDASSKTLFQSAVQPQFGKMNPVEILQIYWSKSAVTVTSQSKTAASVKLVPKQDDLVSSLTATLNAIEQSGESQTLSAPRLTVVNNRPASIRDGLTQYFYEEYTVSQTILENRSTSSLVPKGKPTKLAAGVSLDVLASIGGDGRSIMLALNPAVSQDVELVT
ncbi:MAG TPA: hypothetical protein PLX72_02135, partial [Candidatus Syntrophosphaera sp.]|nr:hypothetical protein [Candidatus Syntrophosphaera sp.]